MKPAPPTRKICSIERVRLTYAFAGCWPLPMDMDRSAAVDKKKKRSKKQAYLCRVARLRTSGIRPYMGEASAECLSTSEVASFVRKNKTLLLHWKTSLLLEIVFPHIEGKAPRSRARRGYDVCWWRCRRSMGGCPCGISRIGYLLKTKTKTPRFGFPMS